MEKVYDVRKTVPIEEIPKSIEVHESNWDGFTGRVFKYELDRIEPNPNDKGFVKVVYKMVS
jgi:hypothetical protein